MISPYFNRVIGIKFSLIMLISLHFTAVSCFPLDSFRLQVNSFGSIQSFILPRSFQGHFFFFYNLHFKLYPNKVIKITFQPIGELNDERFKKFQENYSSYNNPAIPKYHYGSHYSTAGTVGFPIICTLFCECYTQNTLQIVSKVFFNKIMSL